MNDDNRQVKYAISFLAGIIAFLVFIILKISGFNLPSLPIPALGQGNLWAIFLTGLITGGLTCMAVQGGLLAATIAQREEEKLKEKVAGGNALPILAFLGAKLVAYTLLGLLLGSLGSVFQLSIFTRNVLQIGVAIFMIGTAFNILNVHPIFRYFVIQPPHFLTRFIRKQSKSQEVFAPAVVGAFTVFIPCGTTQAMMALAIASGHPLTGAAILFSFVLGTSPVFFILGYFATRLGDVFQQKFMKLAALAIIVLAVFNINNSLALAGVNIDITKPFSGIICLMNPTCLPNQANQPNVVMADNNPTINIESTGYSPSNLTIKAGSPITLHIKNTGGVGCTQSFTIPSLGIQKVVPVGQSDVISFNAPSQPGQLPFMCSMGMFRGTMNVI